DSHVNWALGVHSASGDVLVNHKYSGGSPHGALPHGNGVSGVYGTGTVTNVGGTAAGEGNLISANGGDGVTSSRGTNIQDNRIGTDAAGDDRPGFGNGGNGVLLLGGAAVNNTFPPFG